MIGKLAAIVSLSVLSACVTTDNNVETKNIKSDPFVTKGPMDDALACLAQFAPDDLKLGVSNIDDLTGRYDSDGQGAFITRGGSYMLMTAFAKAGIPQVQRANTKAIEWERDLALSKGLGDGEDHIVGDEVVNYRLVKTGEVRGSTHIASGAFTALDFNIASGGAEIGINGKSIGARRYRMALGLDFIITDTRTTEILFAKSYSKSLEGSEVKAGVFTFLTGNLVNANAGYETHDPIQFGSKYVLEYAAYDFSKEILEAGNTCDEKLPEAYAKAKS